ncbi:iron-sulfur cluster assembly scaffold protein [Methanogenium sp. S4BF]|uniref:iron-sulfur cluster assembly scaffold protein n=1 Tax=Methanogenium sp. S4BF TaxID=1789226 RepID=UPI0024164493|nr:iron-sulfur cluster assembly scaffold protein [Methanogenium sp. S4BF]WFN35344.1 iron-sulfur cluster assembly scaffold protein [Methanogenium sp. S4BF]
MSSRIPLAYNPKVLELFKNPKNQGKMEDADVEALVGSRACGDMIAIYLKIDEKTRTITDVSFESYGCAANIAASSIITEMVKGKTLEEAWGASWKEVSEELGGLPGVKFHCGVLAVGALRRAIRTFFEGEGKVRPSWLPEKLTPDEKHALEEEQLMEVLTKKMERMDARIAKEEEEKDSQKEEGKKAISL